MNALDLVRLPDLMKRGQGRPKITTVMIDGPVARNLPDLAACLWRIVILAGHNFIQRFSDQCNIVTFRPLGYDALSFIFLNVADFKGIRAG
jgi:hypothetical protein